MGDLETRRNALMDCLTTVVRRLVQAWRRGDIAVPSLAAGCSAFFRMQR